MIGILKVELKSVLFVLFIVFCSQFTELKVSVVKIAEILLLLFTPFIYRNKINKWILSLLLFISFWLLISLAFNPFRGFFLLDEVSVLKTPYWISIGRFLELIACVNLAALTNNFLKKKTEKEIKFILKLIVKLSVILAMYHLVFYFSFVFGYIEKTYFVYERTPRLRGWYVEGGPYGLMLSFIFCLTFFYKHRSNNFYRAVLIVTIVFIARSKAGTMFILFWYITFYFNIIYKKIRELSLFFVIFGGILSSFIFVKISYQYIDLIENVQREMKERPTDINLVMGRVAGLFIFPEMVTDNPFFGIGLGNYPIIRNNPEYLDFIPHSPKGKTDAHGFGGIIQILVDGGVFTLLFFLFIMGKFYKKLKRSSKENIYFLFGFLYLFVFGVQIYFLYPWILFGILIALSNSQKNNEEAYLVG
ncbi:O-Antigen ligase [Tenacibaculum sp. MAR_2009_124]|uniref:O-antigen ligase family protein n=1 Tax=Tenacibaculum sp. MAR_2009_124 TaxID=1250059 RepID=UPI0008983575|nr:O-antigen ligase family protein [Tenacibaculum sp. MAR_2009_124]SEC48864.1 O-Antigen ligase [Tenacibaculum sp. MAR_2009_124]